MNFLIPGTARQYIDLKRSRLSVKVKIVKEDGSIPQKDEFVAPINLTLHSLFKEMNIQLQQQSVGSFSNQLYAYKAYMEAIRQPYNRQSFLEAQGFYKDTHGSLNETDPVGANEGFKHRFALFRRSIVDLEGPLMADIFQQDRLLINGVEMKISLTQSKDAFCLMSSKGGWKIQILEACVRICKLTPIPAIILAHDDALKIKPATYPFVGTEMKAYQLNTGHYEFNFEDIFQGAVPTQVVCGFVDSTAYNGSYDSNPFLFHHYDINTIALHLDDESIPSKPLKTNFSEGNIMEAYQTRGIPTLQAPVDTNEQSVPAPRNTMWLVNTPSKHETLTQCWSNAALRLRCWPSIKPALVQHLVFADSSWSGSALLLAAITSRQRQNVC